MSATLLDLLAAELSDLLAPIADAVEQPWLMDVLLDRLGVIAGTDSTQPVVTALRAVADLKNQIIALSANPSPSFAGIAHLLESAKQAFISLRAVASASGMAAELESLGEDLLQLLLSLHIGQNHPLLFDIGVLLTLIEPIGEAARTQPVVVGDQLVCRDVPLARFHPERLRDLIRDPEGLFRAAYLNDLATVDDANAMADKLFGRLANILTELGVRWIGPFRPEEQQLLGDAAPFAAHALSVYFQDQEGGDAAAAGVTLALSSADLGDLGLVVSPFAAISFTRKTGNWTIEFDLTAEIEAFAYGRRGFTLAASAGTAEIDGGVSAVLASPGEGPAFTLGSPTGSRLEVGGAKLSLSTTLSEARQSLVLTAGVTSSTVVIAPGDGDGFVASILPRDGLRATFDLGLVWSNQGGLKFSGAAGLDATIPVGLSIGGVLTVPAVQLGLAANDSGITASVAATIGVKIGPVAALIDGLGLTGLITFPDGDRNLGVANLAFGFKAPAGVGLSVDAAGVSGGGFLKFDAANHEYAGVLQLQFTELALQAFGLITTQVASSAGYSLLALVDASFPPVQLGWGFTLNGVGGLVAVHRTASVDALHAALKADQLSTILFPKNAITNAPQILSQLDVLFPTAPGRFLFGPMALIGWGTPTVLTAAIAVILELPEPIRIVLLARVAVRIPTESNALVRINLDALGVLDLGRNELSLDATLYDSRLITYTLTGDMALRATWSAQREFLLAIGGFHPRFSPPSGFPALKRITIDMPSGVVSKLRLAAYIAITSNSVQFGADLDVFVGVAGFGLSGHLGFDALLQLSPFSFTADISGSVALTAGDDDLMSVSLDASLSGPAPWHIAGSFKIHIVFFDVTISFSHGWGEDAPPQVAAGVDVGALLGTTFGDPRSWDAQLPAGVAALVAVRRVDDPASVLAHPMALLEVHERIVPLGLDITRYGEAAPSGATKFAVTDWRVGGTMVSRDAVQDDFAPAQYFQLSEEEKLARPSFERHDAGVKMKGGLVANAAGVTKTLAYETFFVDNPGGELRTDAGTPVGPGLLVDLVEVLEFGSAGRATIREASNRRYQTAGNPIRVLEPKFVVVNGSNLTAAGIGSAVGSTHSAVQALLAKRPAAERAALEIVATHETVNA